MKTYVIQRDGTEIGTFTKRQLKQGIRSGEVKPSDEMRQDGTKDWHLVGSVSKLSEDLKDSPEAEDSQADPSEASFIINPDSADQTDYAMDAQNPDDTSVDVEGDASNGEMDSVDDSVDESSTQTDTEQARSDLTRATVFATQNYLRRSIFINNADSIQKYGIILQYIAVLLLAIYTYLVYRNPLSPDPLLISASYAAAIIIGSVAASKCRHAGQRLVASTPTSVRGHQPLDMLGLMILTAGLAILVGTILSVIISPAGAESAIGQTESTIGQTESVVWTILYGVLALLATVLASGLVLSPSITNVEIETVTATEEGFGLVALVAKAGLLLSPFVLASCSAIGVLQGAVALYHLWQKDGLVNLNNLSGWTSPLVILLIAGFYPLVMYFVLLVYSMFERMFR
ncbi:MAG: hypothetical protein HOC93_01340 [Phycisphaerae bacterium]|nr:hypothetical protein [Phycisphaerae bacterium]